MLIIDIKYPVTKLIIAIAITGKSGKKYKMTYLFKISTQIIEKTIDMYKEILRSCAESVDS